MSASAERVRRHREKQKAAGKRLVQMWVVDTQAPGYVEECRRQARLIAQSTHDADDMAFLESVADTTGWV